MTSLQITDMVNKIASVLGAKDNAPIIEDIRKTITRCWADKIAITWTKDDIGSLSCANGLTDEDLSNILDDLLRNHDASIGINWGVIEEAVESYKRKLAD